MKKMRARLLSVCVFLAFSTLLGACGLKAAAPETEAARVEGGKQEAAETAAGNSSKGTAGNQSVSDNNTSSQ